MGKRDIIAIGASAGGIDAIIQVVEGFPLDLAAAIFIVIHVNPNWKSIFPTILNRVNPIFAAHPMDGEEIKLGRIYVAPPNFHMEVDDNHIQLNQGPRENYTRPSIDHLFKSVAQSYGHRVIGILLTGNQRDGSVGLGTIKSQGGITIVQDPKEAFAPSMPLQAMKITTIDYVLSVKKISKLLVELVNEPLEQKISNDPKGEKAD